MKLNPININFGKQYVASCRITTSENERRKASIYKYNPEDIDDVTEIKDSPNTDAIKCNFIKMQRGKIEFPQAYEFYAVRDNQTGEIIACTQLSQHYSQKENQEGFYTSIDELETNSNYIDPITPMLGYIAHNAQQHSSNNITTSFRTDEIPELKKCGFRETESENFTMRARAFNETISRAEYRNYLEFVV